MNPDERKIYMKKWRENNREKMAEGDKKWREKNKEKIVEVTKKYREANKTKIKEWREKNKVEMAVYNKIYRQTDVGKKSHRIGNWKQTGVISDDFDALYEYYLNCKNCEDCGLELVEGHFGANKKCLDHDHNTGLFRDILCCGCNLRRG